MGYESKLYIVTKYKPLRGEQKAFARVHAVFNMGKVYALSDVLRDKPATDCYIYADDGDTQIIEDMYGKPLTEATIGDVIRLVEKAMASEDWWKYSVLLATLKELARYSISNMVVLHYGY